MRRETFENDKLIWKIAWSFHKTTGYDVQELFSEATLAYVEAEMTYNPDSGIKFTTYAYRVVMNKVVDFLRKELKHGRTVEITEDIQIWTVDLYAFDNEDFMTHINSWTPDLKFILQILYRNQEVLNSVPPKTARGLIVERLRDSQWSWPRIWAAIKNLKAALNENWT